MPYPNEHSCRLEDPAKYDRFARKNCEEKHDGKCIDVIYGVPKSGNSEIQALRYPKDVWKEEDAKDHCKSRGGTFEPASEEKDKAANEDKTYRCECIECGHQIDSEEHCNKLKCPKCGGQMRRVERPGPGQKGGITKMEIVTKESFLVAYPDLFAEIQKEAYDKGFSEGSTKGTAHGAEAERNRIRDVEGQLISGHEALIETLKYDGKTTGPEAAVQILKREKDLRKVKMDDLLADQGKNKVPEPKPALEEEKKSSPGDKLEALVKDLMAKDKNLTYANALIQVQKENPELAQMLADQLKAGREKK